MPAMPAMTQVAPGVWRVAQRPVPLINVYVVGDVLVDAGRRQDGRRVLAALGGRELSLVALTHVHPDHQGAAAEVCRVRGVPLACHRDDVEAMEGSRPISSRETAVTRLITRWWAGPPRRVDRVLEDGDEVAGFRVVHTPGHTPGEVVYFRERDRVAICGDVIRSISYATLRAGVREPPDSFNADTARNRESMRALAALRPALILPGHGDVVRGAGALDRLVRTLPG